MFNFSDFGRMKNLTIEAFKNELEQRFQQYLDEKKWEFKFNFTDYLLEKLNVTLEEYEELKNEWDEFNWTNYFENKYDNFTFDNFNFSEYFNETDFGFNRADIEKLLEN